MTGRLLPALCFLLFSVQAGATEAQLVPSDRLIVAARAEIETRLGAERGNAQFEVVGAPEDVKVTSGKLEIRARPVEGRWPRPRLGIPVDIVVDGRVVRSATVWFSLSLRRQVMTYAESYAGDTAASAIAFSSSDADVAPLQGDVVSDPAEVKDLQLRRGVPAGNISLLRDFTQVPDIKRGEHIDVLVQRGSIRMSARGVAIDHGLRGDIISVLVDGAESPVSAQIAAKGVVQVVQ